MLPLFSEKFKVLHFEDMTKVNYHLTNYKDIILRLIKKVSMAYRAIFDRKSMTEEPNLINLIDFLVGKSLTKPRPGDFRLLKVGAYAHNDDESLFITSRDLKPLYQNPSNTDLN